MTPNPPSHRVGAHENWIDREARRRLAEETPDAPQQLLPLHDFPTKSLFSQVLDEKAQRRNPGEPCHALEWLIAGSCNGWAQPPTALEMETAIKNRQPTRRARSLATVVLAEADTTCIAHADASSAFSLQDLAWWINETGLQCYHRIKWLNALGRAWRLRQDDQTNKHRQSNG